MKKETLQQLKKKDAEALRHEAADMKEKLSKLQFDLKSGKTAALKEIRPIRKDIAVYLTLMREKAPKVGDRALEKETGS